MMEPHAMEQQRQEMLQLEQIGLQILTNSRNELYLNMRFLNVALAGLTFLPDGQMNPAGTDGAGFYFQPEALATVFEQGDTFVNRLYLHSLLHCLFCHLYQRGERQEHLWNLACDITTEWILDSLYSKCIHLPKRTFRRQVYSQLEREELPITAQRIYEYLAKQQLETVQMQQLETEFYRDDHSLWKQTSKGSPNTSSQQKQWDQNRQTMETEMELFSKEASEDLRNLLDVVQIENRQRYNYREFLRKFTIWKEEMQVDMDTFDYIFYHYGMERYGNMPLIEPLETREVEKIQDFVIVIDTSMSCKEELVQKFLQETWNILRESESFFRKIRVHLIQCDDQIQDHQVITDLTQLETYGKNFTVRGQGGTDFRPAFVYVEQLKTNKQFEKLQGLIYFTDGYGVFPVKKPEYETAFVFLKEDYRDVDVPPWAIKLILEPEDVGPQER